MKAKLKDMMRRRGYREAIIALREANVTSQEAGFSLLLMAVMICLRYPKIAWEDVLEEVIENRAHTIRKQAVEQTMKDALQTVHTRHYEKFEKDDEKLLEHFVMNITSEIRIRKYIQTREISYELRVSQEVETMITRISLCHMQRCRINNRDFRECIVKVGSEFGYSCVKDTLKQLRCIITNEEKIINLEEFQDFIEILLREKDNLLF